MVYLIYTPIFFLPQTTQFLRAERAAIWLCVLLAQSGRCAWPLLGAPSHSFLLSPPRDWPLCIISVGSGVLFISFGFCQWTVLAIPKNGGRGKSEIRIHMLSLCECSSYQVCISQPHLNLVPLKVASPIGLPLSRVSKPFPTLAPLV